MTGKVVLFAKTPELGKAKTRLQPKLGLEGAYQMHQVLVEHCLQNVCSEDCPPLDVWHTGNPEHSFWGQMRVKYDFDFHQQQGADLGERLLFCSRHYLGSDQSDALGWIIFIGSDCPFITSDYLKTAQRALDKGAEIVIGPATDGGYVLLAIKKPFEFLFDDIPWGGPDVLSETLARAQENAVSVTLLDELMDVDKPEDLKHFDSYKISLSVQKNWMDASICALIHKIT